MRRGVAIHLTLGAAVLIGAAPQDRPGPLPGWIAGDWVQAQGASWTEEAWLPPRAGTMIGVGRAGSGERLKSWEVMRIEHDTSGKLTFYAAPRGGPAVGFPMVSSSPTEIVFANPAHDFPQRVRYWRDKATLGAEVSLLDGSRAIRWTYHRRG
jgi:hypothetical protein